MLISTEGPMNLKSKSCENITYGRRDRNKASDSKKNIVRHLANLVNYPILQINAKIIEENQVFTQYAPI